MNNVENHPCRVGFYTLIKMLFRISASQIGVLALAHNLFSLATIAYYMRWLVRIKHVGPYYSRWVNTTSL